MDWYDELPDKGIPSLVHLVKTFGKEWDSFLDEKLIKALITPPQEEHVKEEAIEGEDSDKDQALEISHEEAIIEESFV